MSASEHEAVRRHLAQHRAALRAALEEVELAARRQLDPGRRLAQRRWTWLGVCFGLGLWLGFGMGTRRR